MKSAIGLVIILLSGGISKSQPLDKAELKPHAIPRDVIYRILFREIAAYQTQADQLARQNKPDTLIRNYHRDLLQLSSQHFTKVKNTALDCVRQMQIIDEQAKQIIEAVKSKHKGAPMGSPNAMVPPPPPELLILEERRRSVVLTAADSIATAIGPGQFAYFENIARRHVGSGLTAQTAIRRN